MYAIKKELSFTLRNLFFFSTLSNSKNTKINNKGIKNFQSSPHLMEFGRFSTLFYYPFFKQYRGLLNNFFLSIFKQVEIFETRNENGSLEKLKTILDTTRTKFLPHIQ